MAKFMSESFAAGWKPIKPENPGFRCHQCGSDDVWYTSWDSLCGGYEDVKYECRSCNRIWWVERADANYSCEGGE